jgi:hypothetical protein
MEAPMVRAFDLIDERDTRKSRPLSGPTSEAIRKLFVEGGIVDEADADEAYSVFDEMRREKRRLGCPCKEGLRPRLYAARPDSIKKMPNFRVQHADGCMFVDRKSVNAVSVVTSYAPYNGDAIGVHDSFASASHEPGSGGVSGGGRRTPKISRILYSLIEKSGLNVVSDEACRSPEAALLDAAKGIVVAQSGSNVVMLSDVLVASSTYDGKFVRDFIQMRRRVASWDDWPSGSRPQFYLCGIATGFSYRKANDRYDITIKDRRPRFVDSKPYIFAGDDSPARDPFIYILSYSTSSPRNKVLHGLKSFLHPIHSPQRWCPVDSDRERETLAQLLKWRRTHPLGELMSIEKPLSGMIIDGKMCLPDFLIHLRSVESSIVVETMGSVTTEYQNRKRGTHALMERQWGPVVKHELAGQRMSVANEKLIEELDIQVSRLL